MSLSQPWLARQGILDGGALAYCADGQAVRVVGLVVVYQAPPTANGCHFVTLETETGLIDVIIRPRLYARYRRLLHTVSLLIVESVVQRRDGVINILARRVMALPRKAFQVQGS